MKNIVTKVLWGILVIILVVGVLLYIDNCRLRTQIERMTGMTQEVERIIIRDTVVVERPVSVLTEVVRIDTVRDIFVDHIRDTVVVELPIERKVYEDSLYRAVICGYKPELESITVFPQTTYVNIERIIPSTLRKCSFGLSAGPSALITTSGRVYAGLGVTAGVQYRF